MANKFHEDMSGPTPTERTRGKPASEFPMPEKNISWPALPGKEGTQKFPSGSGKKAGFNHLVKKGVR